MGCKKLGTTFASPIFDGASMDDVKENSQKQVSKDGRVTLFDGRSGEPFSQQTTVGLLYDQIESLGSR